MKKFLIFVFTIILSFGFLCIPFNNNVAFASSEPEIIDVSEDAYTLKFSDKFISSSENYYSSYTEDFICIYINNLELPVFPHYNYNNCVCFFSSSVEIIPWNDIGFYTFDVSDYNNMKEYYNLSITYEIYYLKSNGRFYYYVTINSFNFEMLKPCPINIFSMDIQLFPNIMYNSYDSFYYNYDGSVFNIDLSVRNYNLTYDFDIIYNNQYYYNNYFGIVFDNRLASEDVLGTQPSCKSIVSLYSNEINGNIYKFDYETVENLDIYYLNFLNNYNYNSSYVSRVIYNCSFPPSGRLSVVSDSDQLHTLCDYGLYFRIRLCDSNYNSIYSSMNRNNDNSFLGSSLLPIGTNNLYKNCEWYDVPSHLYNFLIFLVFDCPLISDILSLFYILIAFIVNSFNVIIQFFESVNNTLFITLFIGLIVLSFLFKIIFGGEK